MLASAPPRSLPIALALAGVWAMLAASGVLETLERLTAQARYAMRPAPGFSAPVTIVAIDERALQHYGQMPWDRRIFARMLERLRAERLADILQLTTEPRGLANEMFSRVLYEQGSRYARPEDGSASSVRTIGRAEVESFYAARFQPSVSTLIVVGDVSVDEGVELARAMFGGWKGSASESPPVKAAPRSRRCA